MLSNVSRRWPRPIGPEVLTELTVKSHHAYKLLFRFAKLTLALLMAKVFANDHNASFASDDLALIADLLNAWLHLHLFSFLLIYIYKLLLVTINNSTLC